ncbi:MAG: dTDP-4-dehydrorhamnose 3,5-epimerase [Pseudomonadota bacterium]
MIEPLALPDVKLISPKIFRDERGFFSETYNQQTLAELGVAATFVQDNHSLSRAAGVVRGLHYQRPPVAQGKLVRVIRGAIFDVAVDLRRSSPTFGQHVSAELSAENWQQLWIPPGLAHGFCTIRPDTEVVYKVTAPYSPDHEVSLRFDDPALGIDWPSLPGGAILSDKDRDAPLLADLPADFD